MPNILPTLTTNRRFGVEIEFVGASKINVYDALMNAGISVQIQDYNHRTSHVWKIVDDASLIDDSHIGTGELVSPILSGQAGLETIAKVLEALNSTGAKANDSCGLHVHVDAHNLSIQEIAGVYLTYAGNENHFDSIMPRSRRSEQNQHCRSIARDQCDYNQNFFDRLRVSNVNQLIDRLTYDRYYKVNLQSLTRHNTIEFRHHSGTTNAEKICNWVVFVLSFTEHCAKKIREFNPPEQQLSGGTIQTNNDSTHFTKSAHKIFQILKQQYSNDTTTEYRYLNTRQIRDLLSAHFSCDISEATIKMHLSKIRAYGLSSGNFNIQTRGMFRRKSYKLFPYNELGLPGCTSHINQTPSFSDAYHTCVQQLSFDELFGIAGQNAIDFYQARAESFTQREREIEERRAARRAERQQRRNQQNIQPTTTSNSTYYPPTINLDYPVLNNQQSILDSGLFATANNRYGWAFGEE